MSLLPSAALSTAKLARVRGRLAVCFSAGHLLPFSLDWQDPQLQYRLQRGGGLKEGLARAIGLKHRTPLTVVDATAGMGYDGFLMASWGCTVHMVERSPLVFALLQEAWRRALQDVTLHAVAQRVVLHQADSVACLSQLVTAGRVDVVYLDPMYPPKSVKGRHKQAAVKQKSQVLQALAWPAEVQDTQALWQAAYESRPWRVVVKRPSWAPCLSKLKPSGEIVLKKTRFDIYNLSMG